MADAGGTVTGLRALREEFGDAFEGRRVLVTGATGFLGTHLTAALGALGAHVLGVARGAVGPAPGSSATLSPVDLTDRRAVEKVVTAFRPERVYHLAGLVTGRQDLELVAPTLRANLLGTVHLLMASIEAGYPRFVWVGSADEPVAGGAAPASPYAASKAAAGLYVDLFAGLFALPVVRIRLHTVFGPGQREDKLVPYVIGCFRRGEAPRLGSPDRARDFVFVDDVVRGFLACGVRDQAVGRTVELGSGTATRLGDLVRRLAALTGAGVEASFGVVRDREGEPRGVADVRAARELLGWSPRWSLERALDETVRAVLGDVAGEDRSRHAPAHEGGRGR